MVANDLRRYTNISIQGNDSVEIRKKTRLRYGARIVLLSRTLTARPDYAQSVRELELPEYNTSADAVAERIMAETTISGLIVRCPNLERLSGVYTPYTDLLYENPIHSALRSRRKLKEHLWLMNLDVPLQYIASESFISIHKNWNQLETLVMQGHTPGGLGGGGINNLIFADIFTRLPSLKKLMISRFLNHEFDDNTLLSVPKSITHLRLEELPGVTEPGLQTFLCNPPRKQLTHLYLIDLELLNLLTISKLFNSLTRLLSFTLMQTSTPQPATGTSAPPLRSQTLTHLHWDTLIPAATTLLLARSIRNINFPSLLTLRAPSDHHGTLQSACRPRESIIHPFDTIPRFHNPANPSSYTRSLPHARCTATQHAAAPCVNSRTPRNLDRRTQGAAPRHLAAVRPNLRASTAVFDYRTRAARCGRPKPSARATAPRGRRRSGMTSAPIMTTAGGIAVTLAKYGRTLIITAIALDRQEMH